MIKETQFKSVLNLDLTETNKELGSYAENLPDAFNVYDELLFTGSLDDELMKSHMAYSYCVFMAEEFFFHSKRLTAELDRWAGEKWRKLKNSTKRKYTDADAKRKIESNKYYCETRILIAKYEKLYKQLAFGGGKAIDMKQQNLKTRVNMILRSGEDFNIREEKEEKVKDKIKNRL